MDLRNGNADIPWVQDFILRSHPKQDVNAASDANNYSRAMSNITKFTTNTLLSSGFSSKGSDIRLKLPVTSIGNLGVGIGIERATAEGLGDVLVSRKHCFIRFVSNNKNNSALDVEVHQSTGLLDVRIMPILKLVYGYLLLSDLTTAISLTLLISNHVKLIINVLIKA